MRGTTGHTGRTWNTAGALVLAAALAGCSGGPTDEVTAPSFEPAPSTSEEPEAAPAPSSAEPSVEPSQAAPELPAAATEQTPEGAVAFTEWWFETLNYAYATGDTEALRASSLPGCGSCEGLLGEIEGVYSSGGEIEGAQVALTEAYAPPGQADPARTEVVILIDQTAGISTGPGGAASPIIEEVDGQAATMQALWVSGWTAAGVIPAD